MSRPTHGIGNDQLRAIVNRALAQGWAMRRSKRNHILLTNPDTGTVVVLPSTPSDWRSMQNALGYLRRNGLT